MVFFTISDFINWATYFNSLFVKTTLIGNTLRIRFWHNLY